jgi:hypothetical protein
LHVARRPALPGPNGRTQFGSEKQNRFHHRSTLGAIQQEFHFIRNQVKNRHMQTIEKVKF